MNFKKPSLKLVVSVITPLPIRPGGVITAALLLLPFPVLKTRI
jgi:hypothetical protein